MWFAFPSNRSVGHGNGSGGGGGGDDDNFGLFERNVVTFLGSDVKVQSGKKDTSVGGGCCSSSNAPAILSKDDKEQRSLRQQQQQQQRKTLVLAAAAGVTKTSPNSDDRSGGGGEIEFVVEENSLSENAKCAQPTESRPLSCSTFDDRGVGVALQHIDLEILNGAGGSRTLERIFDEQFADDECWNIGGIRLPDSSAPPTAAVADATRRQVEKVEEEEEEDIIENTFGLSSWCAPNSNTKAIRRTNVAPSPTPRNSQQQLQPPPPEFDEPRSTLVVASCSSTPHCGKTFRLRTALVTHTRSHDQIKPFECHFCWKTFAQKITRDSHVQLHTGTYKFVCSVCHKRFPTRAKLSFHSDSHEQPKWRCDVCGRMFTAKQYLRVHRKTHEKLPTSSVQCLVCAECNATFKKKNELLAHIGNAHPETTFACYYVGCSRAYRTYKKLRDHVYKQHVRQKRAAAAAAIQVQQPRRCDKFECQLCGQKFVQKSSYHRHTLLAHRASIGSVDANRLFDCVHCRKRFVDERGLNEHRATFHIADQQRHQSQSQLPPVRPNFSCPICRATFFDDDDSLKQHVIAHADYSPPSIFSSLLRSTFPPQDGGAHRLQKSSSHQSPSSLPLPLPLPHLRREYKCDCCDRRLASEMELKHHQLDEHKILPKIEELKPYGCLYCTKRFTTRGKCNLHTETHSQNREYGCGKCEKRFFRRDLLRQHERGSHSVAAMEEGDGGHRAGSVLRRVDAVSIIGDGSSDNGRQVSGRRHSFDCDQCGRVLRSKQSLNFHLKKHRGDYRFTCGVCGKKFVRKCHYDTHVAGHSSERPFKCSKCCTAYKTSKHLREHQKKMGHCETTTNLDDDGGGDDGGGQLITSSLYTVHAQDQAQAQAQTQTIATASQRLLDEYMPSAIA